jgi:hypothetical protein
MMLRPGLIALAFPPMPADLRRYYGMVPDVKEGEQMTMYYRPRQTAPASHVVYVQDETGWRIIHRDGEVSELMGAVPAHLVEASDVITQPQAEELIADCAKGPRDIPAAPAESRPTVPRMIVRVIGGIVMIVGISQFIYTLASHALADALFYALFDWVLILGGFYLLTIGPRRQRPDKRDTNGKV